MANKNNVVQAIIESIENNIEDVEIRTNLVEGFNNPDKIIHKGKPEKGFTPDVMLFKESAIDLFEVELNEEFQPDKWRLFSLFSKQQKGKFTIVTPKDNLPDLKKALKENYINATVLYYT
ncbi:MAG: hypothetical protein MUO54_16105 [Anaerolineales bacterium]|nr:hypothetical protein [Anaerolineales bacterium]